MRILYFLSLILVLQFTSAHMAGGRRHYDLNDPRNLQKIEKLSQYGVETIATRRMNEAKNSNSLSSKPEELLKYNHRVISAESQVVAGVNYYISITMNDAKCRQSCAVEECELVIWERVWENFTNLTRYNCELKKAENKPLGEFVNREEGDHKKGVLVGQVRKVEIDANSQSALDIIMHRINLASNSMFLHKINAVTEVKKQMVAGMKYIFEFKISKTSCDKRQSAVDECPIQENSQPLKCVGSLVDRVWMRDRYSHITFDCKN